jgi:hypothetical protein
MLTTTCAYCGARPVRADAPGAWDEAGWALVCHEHKRGCEWVATRAHTVPEVEFAQADGWEAVGEEPDKASRLLCCVHLYGAAHHLEAIAVTEGADGMDGGDNDGYLCELMAAFGIELARLSNVTINGRDYVLFLSPYAG